MKKIGVFFTAASACVMLALSSCNGTSEEKYLLVEESTVNNFGENKHCYEYDENGNLIKDYNYTVGDDIGFTHKYTYDEHDRLLTDSCYSGNELFSLRTFEYNENGDTVLYAYEMYVNDMMEKEWGVMSKEVKDYDSNGKLLKKYSYFRYPIEGDGDLDCDGNIIMYSYDKNGKEAGYTAYNIAEDVDVLMIKKDYNGSPAEEYAEMMKSTKLSGPTVKTMKYDSKGHLVSSVTTQEIDGEKTILSQEDISYDDAGRCVNNTEWLSYLEADCVTSYTYDKDGRMTANVRMLDGNEFKTIIEYNAQGDTLFVQKSRSFEDDLTVTNKEVCVYGDDGKLQKKYKYNMEDEFGYDMIEFIEATYDEKGLLVESVAYTQEAFMDITIAEGMPKDIAKDFSENCKRFKLVNKSTTTYKYKSLK